MTSSKEKIEAILHPVRIRILQILLNGEKLTTQQMKRMLPDISVPTLYRHLSTLANLEIIEIVEEYQIRGTFEKVYALPKMDII